MDLMQASHEWATRPADQRFACLADMWLATRTSWDNATQSNVSMNRLDAVIDSNQIRLRMPGADAPLTFNNWSMSQFAQRIRVPMDVLADLTPDTARTVINEKLERSKENNSQVYYDRTNNNIRAFTSQDYGRVANHEVIKSLMDLPGTWTNPPARPYSTEAPGVRKAAQEDVDRCGVVHKTLGIKVGDDIIDAGLYASDRDMFAFLVNPDNRINDGTDEGLCRGFFVRNSEVGNAMFDLFLFKYRGLCGNHIVWDVEDVHRLKIKHIGRGTRGRILDGIDAELTQYVNASTEKEEKFIRAAKRKEIAESKEKIVELLFRDKELLTKKEVEGAYDLAVENEKTDGNPRSFWGFTQGLTRYTQTSAYADRRNRLDLVGGQILAMAN